MTPPAAHPTVAPLRTDERGVSPVIGTILILGITIVGIAGVLAYGAPAIDRIQARNAQASMEGSFETLRDDAQEMSVPDHARKPAINLPGGTIDLAAGDRFLIASDHDTAFQYCDLHVSDWSDAGASVTISSTGCRSPSVTCTFPMAAGTACLEIDAVAGSTITRQTASLSGGTASVGGADFSKGDWAFRLTDGNANPTVYAEAWLHSADMVRWRMDTATGRYEEFFDGGAVFGQRSGGYYLEKEAPIGDSAFGPGYYGLWLRTLIATGGIYAGVTGAKSHEVSMSLLGVATRVDEPTVYKLRFDWSGPLAQPWCNSFLLRNQQLGGAGIYTEDGTFNCTAGGSLGLRSLTYTCLTCAGAGHPFKFRFLHARIATSLAS
ncbi:MAG: type IV pilin N-terminal domain-containing protein [bacterium]